MLNKRVSLLLALSLALTGVLAGCGSADNKTDTSKGNETPPKEVEKEKDPDPVTLTIYDPSSGNLKDDFMKMYGDPIQKKFPHITINYLNSPDTNPAGNIANLLAAQQPIDIFLNADTNHYRLITPFKFEADISDLIAKHGFDLNKLEPSVVDAVKGLSGGKMYALPYRMSVMALLYNKDLFDKFAVGYPKDGMTWDETYEIAKKMTRTDGDIQYRGFITQSYNMAWMNQLSLGFADPKTDKPLYLTDDRWPQLVSNINRFYEIPGNALAENSFRPINDLFYKSGRAAMYAYVTPTTQQEINWDMVSLPEYSHLRGVGSQAMLTLAYVTSISKHRDEAFKVVAYLASDEFQKTIAEQAYGIPVVKNQAVKDSYGKNNPFLQGKNLKALTRNAPAKPFEQSPYQAITNNQLEKTWYKLGKGQMDVNTALREATEMAEKEIANLKSSGQ